MFNFSNFIPIYTHLYDHIIFPSRRIYFEYERQSKNKSSKKSNGCKPKENGGDREWYSEIRPYGENFGYFSCHMTLFVPFKYAILTRVGMSDGL